MMVMGQVCITSAAALFLQGLLGFVMQGHMAAMESALQGPSSSSHGTHLLAMSLLLHSHAQWQAAMRSTLHCLLLQWVPSAVSETAAASSSGGSAPSAAPASAPAESASMSATAESSAAGPEGQAAKFRGVRGLVAVWGLSAQLQTQLKKGGASEWGKALTMR